MDQDIFLEMEKINNTLLQQTEEEVYNIVHTKPFLESTAAGAGIAALGGTLTAGMLVASSVATPIASLILGAAPIGGLIGIKTQTVTEHNTVCRPTYTVRPDRYDALICTLKDMTSSWWDTMSRNERLTAYFSLFNGLALFQVPKEVAVRLLSYSSIQQSEDCEAITCFLDFVYHQLSCPTDFSTCIQTHLSKLDGTNCPDVVSLYLFVDAVTCYFSEESDHKALAKARSYYDRLPLEYKEFILGKRQKPTSNPAVHQFLLPQLERSTQPVREPSENPSSFDYISRQVYLHLRIPVYYPEAGHMSLSAKLQAIFDSEKYVYEAAESVYSIQSILRDFAHTYGNMKVSRLNDIAEALFRASEKYGDKELRKTAQLVVLEAKLKHDLTTSIQLMHLRCREDVEQISQRLFNSLIDKSECGNTEDAESVADILDDSLRLCLYRIFYDNTDRKAELARRNIVHTVGKLNEIRKNFEEAVIVGEERTEKWLKDLPTPICVETSFSADWEQLSFYKGSFASVLLEDLLGEFLFNAFKYADYGAPFELQFWSDDSFLGITLRNSLPDDIPAHIEGSGLASRGETMALINGVSSNSVAFETEGSLYTTTVRLRRTLFIL